jgi:hypothetical protein
MIDNKTICKTIENIFPEKGECGKDINVEWDKKNNAYIVEYLENGKKARTFLEPEDAALCIDKDRCLDLAFQVNQVR